MDLHSAYLDWITPDAEAVIARHARVSTSNPDRSEYAKLISYCVRHFHWSVFEQASCAFEVLTTRAISPQILRHRSMCFQELSQRYTNPLTTIEIDEAPYLFGLRKQATSNRQSSTELIDNQTRIDLQKRIEDLAHMTETLYRDMLELGVARECARNILPLYTPTRLHVSGTVRSFIHYVGLRGSSDTQAEHRQIALTMGRALTHTLPIITNTLKEISTSEKSLSGWLYV